MKQYMNKAISRAKVTMNKNYGGCFGACIVKDEKIISVGSNLVLKNNDPTAHAEIIAIRRACKKLGTYDLTGCELYTTSYPCPMCLSAIIWANIKKVYYGTTAQQVAEIGFRDDFIYDFIKSGCKGKVLNIMQIDNIQGCKQLLEEYKQLNKTIY